MESASNSPLKNTPKNRKPKKSPARPSAPKPREKESPPQEHKIVRFDLKPIRKSSAPVKVVENYDWEELVDKEKDNVVLDYLQSLKKSALRPFKFISTPLITYDDDIFADA